MLGEELFEKVTECSKEIALYTPSGAAFLHEVSFLPPGVTHVVLILCCPVVVLLVKGSLHHHRHLRELEAEREEEVEVHQ